MGSPFGRCWASAPAKKCYDAVRRGSVVTKLIIQDELMKSTQNRENCIVYLTECKTHLKFLPLFWICASVLLGMFRGAHKIYRFLSSNDFKWIILYKTHFYHWPICSLPPYSILTYNLTICNVSATLPAHFSWNLLSHIQLKYSELYNRFKVR